jgi:hypothetical protein
VDAALGGSRQLEKLVISGDAVVGTTGASLLRTTGTPESWSWSPVADDLSYQFGLATDGAGTIVSVGSEVIVSHDDGMTWTNYGSPTGE